MKKFTKKVVSIAAASFVTVTSVFSGDVVSISAANETETTTTVADLSATPHVSAAVSTTAAASATPLVTVAPLATKAADETALVSVDQPNGQTFYEEDQDFLEVTITKAADVTDLTYSIDNGPVQTITTATKTLKVGQGKIANRNVTLALNYNGKSETYTYTKLTKVEAKATVSASMVKMFSVVKAFEVPNATKIYRFCIPPRDSWSTSTTPVAHIYDASGKELAKVNMTKDATTSWFIGEIPSTGTSYIHITANKADGTEGNYPASEEVTHNLNGVTKVGTTAVYMITGDAYLEKDENNTLQVAKTVPTGAPTLPTAPTIEPSATASAEPTATATTVASTPAVTATAEPTTVPATAEPTATVEPTAAPTMAAYFGADVSAPQYVGTKLAISTKVINATGEYSCVFKADGTKLNANGDVAKWDTSNAEAGSHTITATITDSENHKIELTKTYVLVNKVVPTATATAAVTTTPAVTATATVAPTATATVAPTATATVTTTPAITAVATQSAVTSTSGIISFSKKNKTVGETIKVKFALTDLADTTGYKYTYTVTKGSKTKTLAKKTTKKSVNWTLGAKGTYDVAVAIYDKTGTLVGVVNTPYNVKARVITIKSVKAKKSGKGNKMKVTITSKATATKGTVSYKVTINKKNGTKLGKKVASKAYTKKNVFVWKKAKKGNYFVTVTVKNGKGVVVSTVKSFKL